MNVWRQIYQDYRRYRATDESWFATLFLNQGFWASCVYRISRSLLAAARPRLLRRVLRVFAALAQKIVEIVTGISMPPECEIGSGLYIGHFGSIILPSRGKLGNNCNISQGVTLGLAGRGENRGAPTIGDRVYIGPHAIVVGKITVGDDAVICAGAVVTRSVPPRGVMLGNPARLISYDGSFDYVSYDGMDHEPQRLAARLLDARQEAVKSQAAQSLAEPNPA